MSRTQGTPLWALDPTDLTAATSGTLLSAGLDDAARKLLATRLDHAAAAVQKAGVPGADDWTGGLVVEVPGSDADFQVVTGSAASSASAITICEGGTPRIVVSPEALGLDAEWLDSTLVHEAVHVATDSACVAAGESLGWAVEGLAESVAARADPVTASRNRKLVAEELAAHGVPDALPVRLRDPDRLRAGPARRRRCGTTSARRPATSSTVRSTTRPASPPPNCARSPGWYTSRNCGAGLTCRGSGGRRRAPR